MRHKHWEATCQTNGCGLCLKSLVENRHQMSTDSELLGIIGSKWPSLTTYVPIMNTNKGQVGSTDRVQGTD